ncbi:MAG: hypothetical protein A2W61_07220 [Deltaproteobacteria bacterium RIFCSPLOWO2_01_44_7]|nr:MAG: hypothetical protein A2712_05550 [Deltaproteobacteria bacterium RIFCSPHIGHO2_01_FULL_43_49]OGQ14332.1 MAG: hypothetical protein A3D22_04835 [Deltaproteobacteria bacterium RIFCSPHIGHO2_02_FULL_44_53]OGQ27628.1 MAG: hypothetical protein A3D98_09340 [Deltaproteobacteria bacterium RIFCSPHIGHO2_12_FULL_44_21]OGQ30773.1 MAG: hypothetical protein A2979_01245 [Deltaproteobacteria bacterium RIFCSPLOWO2_01_FULL_45_74]OGQ41660.1 MAG: hypothetical protein A2W61_07220 [Deltaproteobacteria bacterium 
MAKELCLEVTSGGQLSYYNFVCLPIEKSIPPQESESQKFREWLEYEMKKLVGSAFRRLPYQKPRDVVFHFSYGLFKKCPRYEGIDFEYSLSHSQLNPFSVNQTVGSITEGILNSIFPESEKLKIIDAFEGTEEKPGTLLLLASAAHYANYQSCKSR